MDFIDGNIELKIKENMYTDNSIIYFNHQYYDNNINKLIKNRRKSIEIYNNTINGKYKEIIIGEY